MTAMKNSILSKALRSAKKVVRHLPYPLFIPFALSSSLVIGVVHAEHTLLQQEFEVKGGTLPEFAFHPDFAAMLLHDRFHIA